MQPCLPAGAKTVFFRPWSGKEGARSASHCLFLFGPFGVGCPRSDKLLVLYCYEMEPNIPYYHTGAWYISAATVCMSATLPRHIMYTWYFLYVYYVSGMSFGFPNRESVTFLSSGGWNQSRLPPITPPKSISHRSVAECLVRVYLHCCSWRCAISAYTYAYVRCLPVRCRVYEYHCILVATKHCYLPGIYYW